MERTDGGAVKKNFQVGHRAFRIGVGKIWQGSCCERNDRALEPWAQTGRQKTWCFAHETKLDQEEVAWRSDGALAVSLKKMVSWSIAAFCG